MNWINSDFQWPASMQNIQDSSDNVLNQLSGLMNQSSSHIAELSSAVAFNRHQLSYEAETLLALRLQLENLLVQGQIISVHPYQFQVGRRVESGHHLSPDIAVTTLANKLLDSNDKYRPTESINVIGWMIAEPLLADFASATKALFSVVNIPELGMVARRLEKEQSLQADKFTQPEAIIQPRFQPEAYLNQNPLRDSVRWQGAQIAQLESLSSDNQTAVSKLTALAQKRGQALSDIKQAINTLKQSGIQIWTFAASGTPEVIATELSQSSPPGRENSYTFASLFISKQPLTFISELFT